MNQNTVTGDYININLRQLGATSIKEFNSIMHIAAYVVKSIYYVV